MRAAEDLVVYENVLTLTVRQIWWGLITETFADKKKKFVLSTGLNRKNIKLGKAPVHTDLFSFHKPTLAQSLYTCDSQDTVPKHAKFQYKFWAILCGLRMIFHTVALTCCHWVEPFFLKPFVWRADSSAKSKSVHTSEFWAERREDKAFSLSLAMFSTGCTCILQNYQMLFNT